MSTPEPPIPADIWERILAFLRAGKTGRIELITIDGRVIDCALEERIRTGRAKKRERSEGGRASNSADPPGG